MSGAGWKWWAVRFGEHFCGPFDEKDEAIREGKRVFPASFEIFETLHEPLRLADWIDVEKMLELAEEKVAESPAASPIFDEWFYFDSSPDHDNDLGERVKRVCDEWQAANGIVFGRPTFSSVRNKQTITESETPEAAE